MRSLGFIRSGPHALLVSRLLRVSYTSFCLSMMLDIKFVVRVEALVFGKQDDDSSISVCLQKNSLNRNALSLSLS